MSAVPEPYKGRDLPGPASVDAHPKGASPFGVMDMVGNVWQWTDEFVDEHTRAAIVRGGSYYQPQGSMWYFPQAYKLDGAREIFIDGAVEGSGGDGWVPVCAGISWQAKAPAPLACQPSCVVR